MANSLGTLAATQILVMEALQLVYARRPLLRMISLGFTDINTGAASQCKLGQAVVSRLFTVPTVTAFSATPQDRTDTDVSVTLSAHDMAYHQFTVAQYAATNRDLIRESVEPLTVAIANAIVDDVAAIWTPANFPTRTGADAVANGATATKTIKASGWDYGHLKDVRKQLNKAGVPTPRFYVGNSDVYGELLTDLRIVAYLNNQANGEAIKTGRLPDVAGFALDEYPNLPANSANLVAVAGSPDSTIYVARPMRDPREMPGFADVPFPGVMTTVTEPKTGLTLNMEMWIDPGLLTPNIRLHWLHGEAKGNPNNLQLIVTA